MVCPFDRLQHPVPRQPQNALEHLTCAQLNGFWPMTTGCQVLIADGLRGTDEVEVPVPNGEYCKTAKIGRAIMDADVFISLTHFKGHESTGFGGAIKNIGMGCGSRAGKMDAARCRTPGGAGEPVPGCHRCAKECGSDAITYNHANNKAVMLDRKMAEYAVCAGRPCFLFLWCRTSAPTATATARTMLPSLPDIGIFASFDPVALDQACADACLNAQPLPNSQLGQNLQSPAGTATMTTSRIPTPTSSGRPRWIRPKDRHGHPPVCAEEGIKIRNRRNAAHGQHLAPLRHPSATSPKGRPWQRDGLCVDCQGLHFEERLPPTGEDVAQRQRGESGERM